MTTDVLAIGELRAIVESQNDKAEWRQGTYERYNVLVHDPYTLGGSAGERVLLRANTHFRHVENLEAIVALHNAAPVLLEVVAAALAYDEAKMAAAVAREAWSLSHDDALIAEVGASNRTELACLAAFDRALAKVRR